MDYSNVTLDCARIRSAREKASLAQAELAREIGTSRNNLCNIEKGGNKPSADLLLRLILRLDLNPAELFFEKSVQ